MSNKFKPLVWSEEREPNKENNYNHVVAESSLGTYIIEWKGWKEYDSKVIFLNGEFIAVYDSSLEEVKKYVNDYHMKTMTNNTLKYST